MSIKDGVVVECACNDWQLNSEDVFRAQVFYAQKAGAVWRGGLWKFCPWCGSQLEQVKHFRTIPKPDLMTGLTQWNNAESMINHDMTKDDPSRVGTHADCMAV